MQVGEENPALRRIPFVIFAIDEFDSALPAVEAHVGLAPGEFEVSLNGAAFGDPDGNFRSTAVDDVNTNNQGTYYYEPSESEVASAGFVLFKFERVEHHDAIAWGAVGELFRVGELDPTRRRHPIVLLDDSTGERISGVTITAPSQLQTSFNGAPLTNASGSLVEIGDGVYYYQASEADVSNPGVLAIKVAKTGVQTAIDWTWIGAPRIDVGQEDATRRLVPMLVRFDDGVTLASDADDVIVGESGPVPAVFVSRNGAAFVEAPGAFFGDGSGLYFYEATALDVQDVGFLALKYERLGYNTEIAVVDVGQLFGRAEPRPTRRRAPLILRASDNDPTLQPGVAIDSSQQLQTSLNGASFDVTGIGAAGPLVEVGSGLYYYQAAASDVTTAGTLVVRYSALGRTAAIAVDIPAAVPPAIVFVSPDVDGMPAAYNTAAAQEIIIDIIDADTPLAMTLVTAVFTDGSPAETVYRAGNFQTGYSLSAQSPLGTGVRLRVRRNAGWPAAATAGALAFGLVVDAIDNTGAATSEQRFWIMPTLGAAVEVPLVAAADGARDLFALTRELIVWQLRE